MNYQGVDPSSGVLRGTFETQSDSQLDDAIATASACFKAWRTMSFDERPAAVASPFIDAAA